MDEDSKAFLLGFDDSLETPIPPTRCSAQDPLTLDQLTPQRKLTSDIQDALTSTFAPPDVSNAVSPKLPTSPLRIGGRAHTKARPTRSKLTNSHITPDAWSTSRFGDLELEVDSLLRRNSGADSIRGAPTRPGERRPDETRTEPPEGHRLHSEERASELQDSRTDTGPIELPSSFVSHTLSKPSPSNGEVACDGIDTQSTGGSSSRLLNERTYFKSVPQPELAPVPHCLPKSPDRPRPGVDARDQGPLTLSQLSPRKGSEGVLSTQAVPPSPMRTSMKRPISPSLHSIEARDMGKPADKISNERRSKRIKTLQLSLARNVVEPNASSQRLTRAPPAARNFTQQGHRTSLRKDRSASTSSRTLHVSSSSDARRSRAANKRRDENSSSISRPGPATKSSRPSVALPPAKLTKPIAFRFESDARIEARKLDFQSSVPTRRSERHRGPSIPDFRSLHAAQSELAAIRKEHINPTVPLPLGLSTETRAKEREKFEEIRRAKEMEIERQKEEQQKQRELEEQMEIKELRRRAVPKANQVPEWYANAPKRKQGGS